MLTFSHTKYIVPSMCVWSKLELGEIRKFTVETNEIFKLQKPVVKGHFTMRCGAVKCLTGHVF